MRTNASCEHLSRSVLGCQGGGTIDVGNGSGGKGGSGKGGGGAAGAPVIDFDAAVTAANGATCGNGVQDPNEQCDTGSSNANQAAAARRHARS
jgi:hypothetical protein